MPSASERIATAVKPGLLKSIRAPNRISWRSVSILGFSQRGDRINLHGPPRREVSCNCSNPEEQQRYRGEDDRIGRGDLIKQTLEKPGQSERGTETDDDAGYGRRHCVGKNEPENVTAARTKCDPDSHFVRPLSHGIGDDAINSDGCEDEREAGKHTE